MFGHYGLSLPFDKHLGCQRKSLDLNLQQLQLEVGISLLKLRLYVDIRVALSQRAGSSNEIDKVRLARIEQVAGLTRQYGAYEVPSSVQSCPLKPLTTLRSKPFPM